MASGALAKLHIQPQDKKGNPILSAFDVQFNPTSYSISKNVKWDPVGAQPGDNDQDCASTASHIEYDAPALTFGGGGSRSLTLDFFFDVTEQPDGDVRQLTNKIVALTRKQAANGEEPPIVLLSWGGSPPGTRSDFPFLGVVATLRQEFLLFKRDGTPVRARLNVVFTEYIVPKENKREHDPELTTRVLKRGDSLSGLAAASYGDPLAWRAIAEANGLDDPRRLTPGKRLTIP